MSDKTYEEMLLALADANMQDVARLQSENEKLKSENAKLRKVVEAVKKTLAPASYQVNVGRNMTELVEALSALDEEGKPK